MTTDAYSVKHIKYKWKDGSRRSVDMDRSVQLPQFSVGGFRTRTKLEVLSTGIPRIVVHILVIALIITMYSLCAS